LEPELDDAPFTAALTEEAERSSDVAWCSKRMSCVSK